MIILPRLSRESALELLETLLGADPADLGNSMPDTGRAVTYTPVGGTRIGDHALAGLRKEILALAHEHGMPGPPQETARFEGLAARVLRERLAITPNEASHEEVWSYLTCCWLLDVAVWRFGAQADRRRFIGNVNRNTFRRLWWRAEILGDDLDLTQFGEDELVNIMERPTIAADRRLARAVAREFLSRVDRNATESRMQLMREVTKRLLRLTPLTSFSALDDTDVHSVIEDIFNGAAAALSGESVPPIGRHHAASRAVHAPHIQLDASPCVVPIPRLAAIDVAFPPPSASASRIDETFEAVAETAQRIARRAGRVTNSDLREMVAITSAEAREVLQALVQNGVLVRRGVRRGTYYVLSDGVADRFTASDATTRPTWVDPMTHAAVDPRIPPS